MGCTVPCRHTHCPCPPVRCQHVVPCGHPPVFYPYQGWGPPHPKGDLLHAADVRHPGGCRRLHSADVMGPFDPDPHPGGHPAHPEGHRQHEVDYEPAPFCLRGLQHR